VLLARRTPAHLNRQRIVAGIDERDHVIAIFVSVGPQLMEWSRILARRTQSFALINDVAPSFNSVVLRWTRPS
jgi:hypothetical protein